MFPNYHFTKFKTQISACSFYFTFMRFFLCTKWSISKGVAMTMTKNGQAIFFHGLHCCAKARVQRWKVVDRPFLCVNVTWAPGPYPSPTPLPPAPFNYTHLGYLLRVRLFWGPRPEPMKASSSHTSLISACKENWTTFVSALLMLHYWKL